MLTRKVVSPGASSLFAIVLSACASARSAQSPAAAPQEDIANSCTPSQRVVVENRSAYGVQVSMIERPTTAMGSAVPRQVLGVVQPGATDTLFISGQRPRLVYQQERDRMPNGAEWPKTGLRAWCISGA